MTMMTMMMMMLMMMMAKVDDNDGQWWLASSGRWAGAEQQIALDGKTDENTIQARTQNELKNYDEHCGMSSPMFKS